MKLLVILCFILSSCANIKGPSYQGKSHNDQLKRNKSVVMREDSRMKKAMSKERQKASSRKMKHKRNKNRKKYI